MGSEQQTLTTVTCAWCDQPTPPGAACLACGGDPEPQFGPPTGLSAVRERRLAARQSMLAARRPAPVTGDERLLAALELSPGIDGGLAPSPAELVGGTGTPRIWQLPDAPAHPRRRRRRGRAVLLTLVVTAILAAAAGATWLTVLAPHKAAPKAAPQPHPERWATFHGQGFTVMFPSAPATTTPHMWLAASASGLYAVTWAPPPSGTDPQAALAAGMSAEGTRAHATVGFPRTFAIGPYTVEDAVLVHDGHVAVAREMVGPGGTWMLLGTGPAGAPTGWQRFLQSFDPGG